MDYNICGFVFDLKQKLRHRVYEFDIFEQFLR